MVTIGILTIGNELTSGMVQDTNSPWIARYLNAHGWRASTLLTVGDCEQNIQHAINVCLAHCNAVIITGGLGPTEDDITVKALGRIWERPLVQDDHVLKRLQERIKTRGYPWTDRYARQALFPEGASLLANPIGSAWGFSLVHQDRLFIVLPGVPEEATRMTADHVISLLKQAFPDDGCPSLSRTFKCFALPEIEMEEKICRLIPEKHLFDIGFYPDFPEIHLVLTSRCPDRELAKQYLEEADHLVSEALSPHLFGRDGETLAGLIGTLLTQKGLSLATAESCTGGLIANILTDVSGSSAYFDRGVVTYSNASKTALLGVSPETLKAHGAVSEQTAKEMAQGVRLSCGADLGISTTGIAGPSGATPGKPVGTVFMALSHKSDTVCRLYHFHGERRKVKAGAAHAVLMMLREYLLSLPA
ncbi:MAG: competence/damage-inducible protein A [Syntrophobacterales bacterium]|jgi:nicotinamide-nucleotide amidase|nr:competence/damage-inducible protein A [Syntrophobacterales bacterium]